MIRQIAILALAGIMAGGLAAAAAPKTINLTWEELQTEVRQQKLEGRGIRIELSGIGEVKTRLVRVESETLVGESKKPLQQWAADDGNANIPAASVTGLRVNGRKGSGGLIGALAGLGTGVGLGIAVGLSEDEVAIPYAVGGAITFGAIGSVAGYFIGRGCDDVYPYFLITRGQAEKNQAFKSAEMTPLVFGVSGRPSYPPVATAGALVSTEPEMR